MVNEIFVFAFLKISDFFSFSISDFCCRVEYGFKTFRPSFVNNDISHPSLINKECQWDWYSVKKSADAKKNSLLKKTVSNENDKHHEQTTE